MDYLKGFLQAEINNKEQYNEIINYITSTHIRSGKFEGNEYIIQKIDFLNYIIYAEYNSFNKLFINRDKLINEINNYALEKGILQIK